MVDRTDFVDGCEDLVVNFHALRLHERMVHSYIGKAIRHAVSQGGRMPIIKDNSSVPFPTRGADRSPVSDPIVVPALAQKWFAKYKDEGQTSKAKAIPARRFRASWAGKRCDRSLYYALTDRVESEPSTLADYWRFGLGTMVHEYLQDAFVNLFPMVQCEVPVDLEPIGVDGSATVDMVIPNGVISERPTVVEIKTINGFGFKKSATAFKGPAEGPRWSAVVQGALAAYALKADLIVAYLSLENLSPSIALNYGDGSDVGQFAAEWHFTYEQIAEIAQTEIERINRVLALMDMDVMPARELHEPGIEAGAVVFDPAKGSWTVRSGETVLATGRTWMCDYCSHRSACVADGEGGSNAMEVF